MIKTNVTCLFLIVAVIVSLVLGSSPLVHAQTFTVLHTFAGIDGQNPVGGLILDESGNLYGSTYFGGAYTDGVVFKLDKSGNQTVLLNFDNSNGCCPDSALLLDPAGNLYSPAQEGSIGGGLLFSLSPEGKQKVLFNFGTCQNCLRPNVPEGPLLRDPVGNLYGTTLGGGKGSQCRENSCGTIFKFDTAGKLHVLYAFTGGRDGKWPFALLQGADGSFYGTALYGGDLSCPQKPGLGCGTLFKLSNGKLKVLHTFTGGADGAGPQPGLLMDANGNLYGVAEIGGSSNCDLGCGTLFKLSTSGKFKVLYTFTGGLDGNYPNGGLVTDASANLYGTTGTGTTNSFYGTIFKLTKAGRMIVLHQLNGDTDGATPTRGLVQDSDGNLYGTAEQGFGRDDRYGTVFKLTP